MDGSRGEGFKPVNEEAEEDEGLQNRLIYLKTRIMQRKELFDKTVSILVKAYFDETLNAIDCRACAVGNILGHDNWSGCSTWFGAIERHPVTLHVYYENEGGYELAELSEIEYSFLLGCGYLKIEDVNDRGNFNGLMSVLEALQKIHKCTDKEKEQAKLMLQK